MQGAREFERGAAKLLTLPPRGPVINWISSRQILCQADRRCLNCRRQRQGSEAGPSDGALSGGKNCETPPVDTRQLRTSTWEAFIMQQHLVRNHGLVVIATTWL